MVLNALDAAERGAAILTRTQCVGARRVDRRWHADLVCQETGARRTVHARAMVNSGGPRVEQVLGRVTRIDSRRRIRLIKGSHIVTRIFWEGPQAYLLQNTDSGIEGLGRHLGGLLYAREVDYLCRVEWARTPEDILERRTKHGLHLSDDEKRAPRRWLQRERPTVEA